MTTATWRKPDGFFCDSYGSLRIGWFFALFGLGAAVFVAILWLGILFGSRAYGRGACSTWGREAGFETKFVLVGWADTGTCLAKAPNGQWVLNTKVQQFIRGAG